MRRFISLGAFAGQADMPDDAAELGFKGGG
jgi:hypothetical protein